MHVPIQILAFAVVALIALLVALRGFRLPRKYYANERERQALRRRLIEREYERVHPLFGREPESTDNKKK